MLSFNINIFIYFLLGYLLSYSALNMFFSIEFLHNGDVTNTGIFLGLIIDTTCVWQFYQFMLSK